MPSRTRAARPITMVERPRLKGRAQVGETVRLAPGRYTPSDATTTYHWFVDGRRLRKATGTSLKLRRRWVCDDVVAQVVVTRAGYATITPATRARTVAGAPRPSQSRLATTY